MDINFELYKIFYHTVSSGSFSNAAEKLFITQSAVSQAIGQTLNTGDLGLSQIGVTLNGKGQLMVDSQMRTSVDSIFAVGDIVEGPQLSHKAQRQGLVAAETIARLDSKMNSWAIFMQPEIAGVGKTEAAPRRQGLKPTSAGCSFMLMKKP